jgi:hypothetical protein
MIKLVADDRERLVIPHLYERVRDLGRNEIELNVCRIQIGDYAIHQDGQILFSFERKSWSDMAASIKDGRKANIEKLITLRESVGCKLIYLIEGKARYAPDKKFGNIAFRNLQAHLDHSIVAHNIHVIYSDSPCDTALRLVQFIRNYLSLPPIQPRLEQINNSVIDDVTPFVVDPNVASTTEDVLNVLNTVAPKTDLRVIYDIWCCIPGITDKTASLFLDQNWHISDLLLGRISRDVVSTMKYPNGALVGVKRATKLLKIQNLSDPANMKYYYQMLSCVKGITKVVANTLLNNVAFGDILSGNIRCDVIANIKKSEKSKIGKSAAAGIVKFFTMPLPQF